METLSRLLSDLVQIPSTHSRPRDIERCADYVIDWLENHGIECRKHVHNGVPTITALPAPDRTPILLMSHLDVVEAPLALFKPRRQDGKLYKEKGILRLKLTSRGRAAHGARPWLGVNAIEALIADYDLLRAHFPMAPPDYWHRTLNWSVVKAGQSVNQVPDRAEALFDVRFTENDDPQKLVADLRARLQGELEVQTIDPVFQAGDSPFRDRLRAIAPGAEWGMAHGASDARFLAAAGIPGVVWGANGNLSQHTDDEHVELQSIARLYDHLDRLVFMTSVPESENAINPQPPDSQTAGRS